MTDKRETKLSRFLQHSEIRLQEQFEAMKCKCFFTKHLYQYLKADKLQSNDFKITTDTFKINLHAISKSGSISRNTCKKAFKELLKLGLLIVKENQERFPNGHYKVILVNDKYISNWNKDDEAFNFKFNGE